MSPFQEKRFLPKHMLGHAERDRLTQGIKDRLSREPDILFAYVHGSFAGDGPFRDIDVAVFTGVPKGLPYESDLSYELTTVLGHEVEVRVINDAPVAFQFGVLHNGLLLLSRDDERRTDFIEAVGRAYREYAHFRNVFMEAVGAER